ncbi:MAG: HEAT repeat domain-containing protein, partial [Candidatus Odinarchaeota archaeon]
IESIGEMAEKAKNSAGFLVSLLSDKNLNIQAVLSLGKLGDTDVINQISESIDKNKSEEFRREAMRTVELLKKLE